MTKSHPYPYAEDPHQPAKVYRVTTVYGDTCFIRVTDYNSDRIKTLIPLCLKNGVHRAYRTNKRGMYLAKPGEVNRLHRDNIAKLSPITTTSIN